MSFDSFVRTHDTDTQICMFILCPEGKQEASKWINGLAAITYPWLWLLNNFYIRLTRRSDLQPQMACSQQQDWAAPSELGRVCGICRPVQKTPKNVYLPIKLLPQVPTLRRNLSEDMKRCHLITQSPHPWSFFIFTFSHLAAPFMQHYLVWLRRVK